MINGYRLPGSPGTGADRFSPERRVCPATNGKSDNPVVRQFFLFVSADTQHVTQNFVVKRADRGSGPVGTARRFAELGNHRRDF